MTNQISFNEAWKSNAPSPSLKTLGLRRKISIPKRYLKYTFSKRNMLVLCLYKLEPNQTIRFCPTALLDLHGHKIEKHKKSNWSRVWEKDTFFWLREIAFLALMQLRWTCTGTRFLLLWEQIDKCGDCAEPCRVHRCSVLATTLQHVSSRGERATKTLLTSH